MLDGGALRARLDSIQTEGARRAEESEMDEKSGELRERLEYSRG